MIPPNEWPYPRTVSSINTGAASYHEFGASSAMPNCRFGFTAADRKVTFEPHTDRTSGHPD
jgi:hypothetical protein